MARNNSSKEVAMKSFIIVGGNFQNTGAASMTLITVDALRKKYPDCRIVMFATSKDLKMNIENYSFEIVHMSERALIHAQENSIIDFKYLAEGIVRIILNKGNLFKEYSLLKDLLSSCSGVFDINGYAISSQFRNQRTISILDSLVLFSKYEIPYYFLPQSFGPFDFKENKMYMIKRLKEDLPKAHTIFTREHEGHEMLTDMIGGMNIVESYDMVLQSSELNVTNIYKRAPSIKNIAVSTKENIAIIPNMRNFDHGNKDGIVSLYKRAIEYLCQSGKNVYLISHSAEDMEVCKLIKEQLSTFDNVKIVNEKIDSFNFALLIRQFDFAIASRFHSIVHSYKAGIPCIALGWATKYKELLNTMGQNEYLFDVRKLEQEDAFLDAIKDMIQNYKVAKEVIQERLKKIQATNCFDYLDF